MGLALWCAGVPIVIFLIRKYRELVWGTCNDKKSLKNKIFIVTGASSGLGKETVKELAIRGARVIMACRDLEKTKNVIIEIRQSLKTGELIPMELDLASFESIKLFGAEIKKHFPCVDVLINNAGVSVPPKQKQLTADGFEINFGVNYLGHFLLTQILMDTLKASPSRVILVTSSLLQGGEIDFESFRGTKDFPTVRRNQAYNNSKLAVMYFCRELSRTLPSNVQVFAVCPGFCYTDLFRYSNLKWYQYIMFLPIALFFLRSANKGCQTILHCALSDEVNGKSGQAFRDCKLMHFNYDFDDSVQKKLWNVSHELVK